MPALADPTTWRKQHFAKSYLFLLQPEVVFKAQVNGSISFPVADIPYDNVTTGAYTDVKPGMTVVFGSTDGDDDLGRQRVRAAPTSDTLYVGWSSPGDHDGELTIGDNAYITVWNDYRVWARVPRITSAGTLYRDYNLAAGDYPTKPPPIANLGSGYAAL